MNYLIQVLVSVDQLVNALFGGWADESISSRAWRLRDTSRFWSGMRILVDTLLFIQTNHCLKAYESEQLRLQEPPELRK